MSIFIGIARDSTAKSIFFLFLISTFLVDSRVALADTDSKLFDGLGKNIGDSFSGTRIFYHLSAFASTPVLIRAGSDARVYDNFRDSSSDLSWPGAVLIGSGAAALITGASLFYSGHSSENRETIGAAFVIAQASLITVGYVIFLKSLTGRAHPTNSSTLNSQEQAEQFEFGFKRLGIGYGWPSGHVSHTVAVTTALAYYYPDKTWLKWTSLGLSTYMLYTISSFHSGQMHWFSDGVAGAFIGYAIGSTVGKNSRYHMDGKNSELDVIKKPYAVTWLPIVGGDSVGLSTLIQF